MRVLGDRVLVAVRPEPDELTSAGGIVLTRDPDIIRTPTQGIVVQVGEKPRQANVDDERQGNKGRKEWNARPQSAEEAQQMLAGAIRTIDRLLVSPPFDVQVGDCVLFTRFVGQEFTEHGITYLVLREADIIGVIEKEAAA